MTTETMQRDLYKLETRFVGDVTIHTVPTMKNKGKTVQSKWQYVRDLGAGSFGVVWLEEEKGGQLRAVKRMTRGVKNVDSSQELSILAQLKEYETLFVRFLGWYEDKHFVYFAMEYVQHGDLSQYLETSGLEVAQSQAKSIVTQVLKGLVVLHQHNICHRDIKPKNILIASILPIQVKIADFGMSKRQNNTSLRTSCGTLHYIAPELQGFVSKSKPGSYTNLVDLWSLGILTHEILTLKVPFLPATSDTDPEEVDWESGLGEGMEFPQMDMQLFSDYCRNTVTFPINVLQASGVDEKGIAFVKALLVADPRFRLSAADALQDSWFQEVAEGDDTMELREAREARGDAEVMGVERDIEASRITDIGGFFTLPSLEANVTNVVFIRYRYSETEFHHTVRLLSARERTKTRRPYIDVSDDEDEDDEDDEDEEFVAEGTYRVLPLADIYEPAVWARRGGKLWVEIDDPSNGDINIVYFPSLNKRLLQNFLKTTSTLISSEKLLEPNDKTVPSLITGIRVGYYNLNDSIIFIGMPYLGYVPSNSTLNHECFTLQQYRRSGGRSSLNDSRIRVWQAWHILFDNCRIALFKSASGPFSFSAPLFPHQKRCGAVLTIVQLLSTLFTQEDSTLSAFEATVQDQQGAILNIPPQEVTDIDRQTFTELLTDLSTIRIVIEEQLKILNDLERIIKAHILNKRSYGSSNVIAVPLLFQQKEQILITAEVLEEIIVERTKKVVKLKELHVELRETWKGLYAAATSVGIAAAKKSTEKAKWFWKRK